jgi:hypothetical protein
MFCNALLWGINQGTAEINLQGCFVTNCDLAFEKPDIAYGFINFYLDPDSLTRFHLMFELGTFDPGENRY